GRGGQGIIWATVFLGRARAGVSIQIVSIWVTRTESPTWFEPGRESPPQTWGRNGGSGEPILPLYRSKLANQISTACSTTDRGALTRVTLKHPWGVALPEAVCTRD